jgi:uncharacterized repeat protein (TIGR03837 family)
MPGPWRWDLFCRVIDNHGDLGVCWRLARDLASRGHTVRLWVDDSRALRWMAPRGAAGVQVLPWPADAPSDMGDGADALAVGDVVVEAFGCDPPPAFVQAMVRRPERPVWINLEYLSAESYVERSHGLPSPTASGLVKWFFFPGFSARTGGLLREPRLAADLAGFDGPAWLAANGWPLAPGERAVSLFSYALAHLPDWLPQLAQEPTLLLVTPGPALAALRQVAPRPGLRVVELPWLTQGDYDRLLWSCALNAVRGEDSFVRALWAPAPLLWQIYPQHDGVHATKLRAFLDRYLDGAPPAVADAVRPAFLHWNGLLDGSPVLPDLHAWGAWHRTRQAIWQTQDDLTTALCHFVAGKRVLGC